MLRERYPHYARLVAQHVKLDAAGPYRFAVTMELFRRSNLPTILMLTHDLGGGVRRHILDLVKRTAGQANCLLLESTARGAALSVPALPGHPELALPADRATDLAMVLKSAGVSRAHIHHLMSMDVDVRALVHRLGVPFDVTVHDYFAICPQVNLLPWLQGAYCGEPDIAGCNACIADRSSHGARDIVSWRRAQCVAVPRSRPGDLSERGRAPAAGALWPGPAGGRGAARAGGSRAMAVVAAVARQDARAARRGASACWPTRRARSTVMTVAAAADPAELAIHRDRLCRTGAAGEACRARITVTGEYEEAELPGLLAKVKPHVVWFPAQWPETYSYTLSAAIDAGLPIVATRIGAFPERLEGRPLTWLVDPEASTEQWLAVFEKVRGELVRQRKPAAGKPRKPVADFYAERLRAGAGGTARR